MSEREDRGNRVDGRDSDEALAKAARANHLEMAGREAVFRRYGYDSAASIAYEIQQAEGKTHPHPARRFPHWQAWLRELGFRTRTWCGCHQEVLVAQGDASEGTAPEATVVVCIHQGLSG